jgi:TonB family protein
LKQFIQCCLCIFTLAQTAPAQNNNEVYKVVDNMPKAPYNMGTYLSNHVQYPQAAIDSGIQGKVYVQFIVETDSSISNVKATRGAELGGGLPAEAERLVREMPKWAPGTQKGVPVRVYFTMPVNFKLEAPVEDTIYRSVTFQPRAPYDWNSYLANNLKYPVEARQNDIQAKIYIKFVVEKDGSITNVAATKKIAIRPVMPEAQIQYGLPEEAERVIRQMPNWTPGMMEDKPVRTYFTVPIVFRLQ